MSDEPILELPPLNDAGAKSADPGDALSPFELPPFPETPAPGTATSRFELPPGFDDLDLAAPESPAPRVPEPTVIEDPLPDEAQFQTVLQESPEPPLPEPPVEEDAPLQLDEPTAPVTGESPVQPEMAMEPTEFHPDGSLERMVEALERTLPKPSAESPTTLRRASRTGKRYLRFILDNRAFLIDADRVREIGLVPPMTFLPRTPDWVRGLTNLRGEMLSVVDLRRYLGFGESVPDPFLNRLVVVTSHDGDLQTGLIVDRVDGFARVEEASLLPLPDGRDVPANRYLSGAHFINDDVAALLDINELLNAVPFRRLDVA